MRFSILTLILIACIGCGKSEQSKAIQNRYSHDIGDIIFDKNSDKKDFHICDSTNISTSRRGLAYDKPNGSVERACMQKFQYSSQFASFSGFVTIRFIVNCQYETDRFRVETMNFDFSKKECPVELTGHLLQIVSALDRWQPSFPRYDGLDHAKYLNFKIEKGRIVNVLQ